MSDYARGRELGLNDGWNDALDAIADRLLNAESQLRQMIADDVVINQSEDGRLRGKLQGVMLAHDYARGMKR